MRSLRPLLVVLFVGACDPDSGGGDVVPRKAPDGVIDSKYQLARWLDNSVTLGRLQPEVSVVADFKCHSGWGLNRTTTVIGEYCRETGSGLQTETCVHEIVRRTECVNGQFVTVVPTDEFGDPLYPWGEDVWDIHSTCTPTASMPGDVCDAIGRDGVECGQPHAYCRVGGVSWTYEVACYCNGEEELIGVGAGMGYPGDNEGALMLICDSFVDSVLDSCPAPVEQ